MRKKLISLILVGLGVLVLLGGIVASTALKPDSQVTLSTPVIDESPYLRMPAEVLSLVDPNVEIIAQAPDQGEVALILGRTSDIAGWIGSESSYIVTGAEDWSSLSVMQAAVVSDADSSGTEEGKSLEELAAENQELATQEPEAAETNTEEPEAVEENAASVDANPLSSDMWISYVSGSGEQKMSLQDVEPGLTLLAVSLDPHAGSPVVSATWERSVTTPLLMPSLIFGILLAAVGIALAWVPGKKPAPRPAEVPSAASADENISFGGVPTAAQASPFADKVVESAETAQSLATKRTGMSSIFARKTAGEETITTPMSTAAGDSSRVDHTQQSTPVAPVQSVPARSYFEPTQNQSTLGSSAPSVASAASIARAVAEEPDLNTAELRQLGLTRRQLREMRESAAAFQGGSESLAPSASESVSQSNMATQNSPDSLGAIEETTSRTSGSNWRAAWGVRAGSGEVPIVTEAGVPIESKISAPEVEASEAIAQIKNPFAPRSTDSQSDGGTNSLDDGRKPASWWGQESPAEPVTRRSLHSSGSYDSAQSSSSAPEQDESSNSRTRNPGTRRALYSNYRAEAERLSAEGDWPVPAPTKNQGTDNTKDGE